MARNEMIDHDYDKWHSVSEVISPLILYNMYLCLLLFASPTLRKQGGVFCRRIFRFLP